jgi:predicted amidohydrolase
VAVGVTVVSDAVASRTARIAVAQYAPRIGEVEHNRGQAVRWASNAAREGAQLIVLPELAGSGYAFGTLDEARSLAEDAHGRDCNPKTSRSPGTLDGPRE